MSPVITKNYTRRERQSERERERERVPRKDNKIWSAVVQLRLA